jgi:hypothetical protein
MEAKTTELYDEEAYKITEEVRKVQTKWYGKQATGENLMLLANEIKGRLNDLGFLTEVDVTPALVSEPIEVRVIGRTEAHTFDWEKKSHEVRKSRKEGGI